MGKKILARLNDEDTMHRTRPAFNRGVVRIRICGIMGLAGLGWSALARRHPENPIILAILILTVSRRDNGQRWPGPAPHASGEE